MNYEVGKPFICEDIGKTKKPKYIDYIIPTENDNFKYLNLIGREAGKQFESEFIKRKMIREKYERDKASNKRESGESSREPNTVSKNNTGEPMDR